MPAHPWKKKFPHWACKGKIHPSLQWWGHRQGPPNPGPAPPQHRGAGEGQPLPAGGGANGAEGTGTDPYHVQHRRTVPKGPVQPGEKPWEAERRNRVGGGEPEVGRNSVQEFRGQAAGKFGYTQLRRAAGPPPVMTLGRAAETPPVTTLGRTARTSQVSGGESGTGGWEIGTLSTDRGVRRQGLELWPWHLLLGPKFWGQKTRREPEKESETERTGGSGQAGCREMCPSVTQGVLGERETEILWRCANSGLRAQMNNRCSSKWSW